jgi:AsmA-like C-terminal region/AsmA family
MNTPTRSSPPLRPLVFALAAVLAVIVIAWGALALLFPPARIRTLLQSQLSRSLRREVAFESVALHVFPPVRLTAKQVRIGEPGGLARGVALGAAAFDLDLDVIALLQRRLVLRSVTLDRPSFHLVLEPDGATNFDSLATSSARQDGAPMDVAVRTLSIRGGRVLIDDLRAHRRIAFGLDTKLAFAGAGGGRQIATSGRTQVSDLAFGPTSARRLANLNSSLAKLDWVIDHDGRFDAASGRLTLAKLALELGRARISLAGTVDHPGPRATLDLRARGSNVELADVLSYLSAADAKAVHGIRGGGRLAFDLTVRGAIRPGRLPDLGGTLSVTDGSFGYPMAPPVEGVRFTARFAPDVVEIADLRARVADQPLRALLSARRFSDPLVRFAVQGNLDLAAVAPLVVPKDTKLTGRADLNVRGEGRAKDPGSIALEGRATLAAVSVEAPKLPKRVDGITAAIQFSPTSASVRGLTARAGKSSFRMTADVARPLALMAARGKVAPAVLEFTFDSPYLDLAELLPPGPAEPIKLNARGGGRVNIARLINQKLDVRNVAMNVSLEPAVIAIPSFTLDAYGGRIRGNSRLDFTSPFGLAYTVKGEAQSVRAEDFLAAWTPVQKGVLTGTFDTGFDLSGDGLEPAQVRSTLAALGYAAFVQGQIGGPVLDAIATLTRTPEFRELRFKDARLPFRVEHGRVVTDSARFVGSTGEWRVAGAVGFDGALDYAVSTTLPPNVAARLGLKPALAAGALADDKGRVLIDLHVGGTAKSPRIAWNTRSMRDRLAGKASTLLTEQREKIKDELLRQTGAGGGVDSVLRALPKITTKTTGRELEKQGHDLLQSLFGRKPAHAPADSGAAGRLPAAPGDSAARDTTRR